MDSISEFITILEADHRISASTLNAYKNDLNQFIEYLNSNAKQQHANHPLSGKTFSRFLDYEKKLGRKPSTLHRRRVTLKKYAEFLNQKGKLASSDVAEVAGWQEDLWEEIANRKAQHLSESEITKLFEALGDEQKPRNLRDKLIISLILETGLSIGVLIDLNLSDVNLRNKQIRVANPHPYWCPVEESASFLREYLEISRPELTQSLNEEALFVSQMGGRITRQGAWQVIRAWGETSGIKVPLSPRVLRHTAVKHMLMQGKSAQEIQTMLGHGNLHSTQALIRKITKSFEPRRRRRT